MVEGFLVGTSEMIIRGQVTLRKGDQTFEQHRILHSEREEFGQVGIVGAADGCMCGCENFDIYISR